MALLAMGKISKYSIYNKSTLLLARIERLRNKLIRATTSKPSLAKGLVGDFCIIIEYVFWNLKLRRRQKACQIKSASKIISQLNRSETVYILGNAPIINSLSLEGRSHLEKSVTLGLNAFFLHDLVPTYLCIEPTEIYANEIFSLMNKRYSISKPNVIFVNKFHGIFSDLNLEVLTSKPFCWLETCRFSGYPFLALKQFYMKIASSWLYKNIIIHNGGSLTTAIGIASRIACKRIVLVGIELKGNDSFYDYLPYSGKEITRQFLKISAMVLDTRSSPCMDFKPNTNTQIHPTACSRTTGQYNEHPVQLNIRALMESLAQNNLSLEVASRDSLLLDFLVQANETNFFFPESKS